jgi:hypothetical protein
VSTQYHRHYIVASKLSPLFFFFFFFFSFSVWRSNSLFRRHLLRTAGLLLLVTAAAGFILLHLFSLYTSELFLMVWFLAPVNQVFPVYKFMEEVKWRSDAVELVTISAGRVEILFSGRLAGSGLGRGVGTFG